MAGYELPGKIAMTKQQQIIMVGTFPPPMHGMAAVNSAVRDRIVEADASPTVIDVSANSLDRSLSYRLGRVPKIVRGLAKLMFSMQLRDGTLYMSVSGGFGQIYEACFILLARLRRMRVYLHHHSFAYLDRPSWLTRILTVVAGPNAVHVTQSQGMAARLREQYSGVGRVVAISNVVYMRDVQVKKNLFSRSLRTIGFISNVSRVKGIFEFLDLVAACEADGLDIAAKIAGPFQDRDTEKGVRERLATLSTVEYVGPKYGNEKEEFFSTVDTLIFPTLYTNETEGIVNHEAMGHGMPVIAYGRGCVPEIINSDCGMVVDPAGPFVPAALAQIKEWLDSPEVYRMASRSAGQRFAIALAENALRWRELLGEILGRTTDVSNFESNLEGHHQKPNDKS